VSKSIQITYKEGVNPDGPSGYGRGTTEADKEAGNTSVRFHEQCHVNDLQAYLSQNKPPEFLGTKGMTREEFLKAHDEYKQKLKEYSDLALKDSEERTHCVGTKLESCK
jgi:hypothetical protein